MPRLLWPIWRWMTTGGTPSRVISTARAWRGWCGARRCESPRRPRVTEVGRGGGAGPLAATCRPVEGAEQRSDGKVGSRLEPGLELLLCPREFPEIDRHLQRAEFAWALDLAADLGLRRLDLRARETLAR